ncbi:MAG: hypothetical protein U9P49_07970 [Thermodesulfobacteriota bacterium]|nr:hypothetical protein [Thermodesulfobacteriota bacterium]
MEMMSKLFENSEINGIELSNRFVRSATWEGMATDDGAVTPKLIETMVNLANAGLDAIELSGGLRTSGKLSPSRAGINAEDKEAYFKEDARAFKNEINIPLILVGGTRSFDVAERIVEEMVTDYISMSRPFIREPDLINRWKAGDRSKAKCKSDNLCFSPIFKGDGVYCVTKEHEKTE